MIRSAATANLQRTPLCAIALCVIAASSSNAAGCMLEPQGEGHVSAVIDARTFRLQDGREVRLAGIEPIEKIAGKAALEKLIANRDVTLHGDDDAPDRYGRQIAFVIIGQSETTVQNLLVSQGEALFSGATSNKDCASDITAAEAEARQARRGTWAGSAVIKSTESPGDILSRIGQFTVVEGKVLSVRQAGAVTYINFGRRWTRDFAVTISRRAVPIFEASGISLKSLENKRIRVRGWIEARGGPRIEALRAGQIELVGSK